MPVLVILDGLRVAGQGCGRRQIVTLGEMGALPRRRIGGGFGIRSTTYRGGLPQSRRNKDWKLLGLPSGNCKYSTYLLVLHQL